MDLRQVILATLAMLFIAPSAAAMGVESIIGRRFGPTYTSDVEGSDAYNDWEQEFARQTLGVDDHANFGIAVPTARANPCGSAPAQACQAPSKDGNQRLGLRAWDDQGVNRELLADLTGGWGVSYRRPDGVQRSYCWLDEAATCPDYPGDVPWAGYDGFYDSYGRPGHLQSQHVQNGQIVENGVALVFHEFSYGDGGQAFGQDWVPPAVADADRAALTTIQLRVSGKDIDDVLYRRTILFSPPGGDGDYTLRVETSQALPPTMLRWTSNNGFAIPNPLAPEDSQWSGGQQFGCGQIEVGPGVASGTGRLESGPCQQGLMFELDFGFIPRRAGTFPPASCCSTEKSVTMFLGSVDSLTHGYLLMDQLEASAWAFAIPEDPGVPIAFWAIQGIYTPVPPVVEFAVDSARPPAGAPLSWTPQTPCALSEATLQDTTFQLRPALLKRNRWTVDGVAGGWNEPPTDWSGSFDAPGPHAVTLEVENDRSLSATLERTVEVLDCTPAPSANLWVGAIRSNDCAPTTVSFLGMEASSTGGPLHLLSKAILDFGDGTPAVTFAGGPLPVEVLHDYTGAGTFTATLLVLDDHGLSATVSRQVTTCANRPPQVNGGVLRVRDGAVLHVPLPVSDPDLGSTVSLTALGLPADAQIATNVGPGSGHVAYLDWAPGRSQVGVHHVVLVATDDQGATSQAILTLMVSSPPRSVSDTDHDGVADSADDCHGQCEDAVGAPVETVPANAPDFDGDGVPDVADNCPRHQNARQDDLDADRSGDACDPDLDGDGILELESGGDNCPGIPNPGQEDADADQRGDACSGPIRVVPSLPLVSRWQAARGRDLHLDGTTVWATGLAGLALVLLGLRGRRLGVLALFSRLARAHIQEHPLRARLLELVQARPGIHFLELCRVSGARRGTVEYHLKRLRTAGFIESAQDGRRTRFTVVGAAAAGRSLHGRANVVLEALCRSPGLSIAQIAQRNELPRSTVAHHVKRLQDGGLVEARGPWGRRRFFAAEGAASEPA